MYLVLWHVPKGVLLNKKVGGLGPHIKFGGKVWGKVRPSSQNKRKTLGSSVTTRCKSWEKVPILGSYLKLRGVFVIYIFGGQIWGSNNNFRGKFWSQAPRPPNMEVPPWGMCRVNFKSCSFYSLCMYYVYAMCFKLQSVHSVQHDLYISFAVCVQIVLSTHGR